MSVRITNEIRIMDISLNLSRIGNWTADSYESKKSLIERFLSQTTEYIKELNKEQLSANVRPTFLRFEKAYNKLLQEKINEKNKDAWAECALTWAKILQHRAKLA